MKFIKIGDVVVNVDMVFYVDENKAFGGVNVWSSGSSEDHYIHIRSETMESMLEKLNRVPESLRSDIPNLHIGSKWEPDWSQAPDWAVAWAMDMSGECYWHSGSEQPKVKHHIFESSGDGHTFEAPSFSYKGDWKDSLRKRTGGK